MPGRPAGIAESAHPRKIGSINSQVTHGRCNPAMTLGEIKAAADEIGSRLTTLE